MDVERFIKGAKKIQLNLQIPEGSTVCFIDSSFNPPHYAHLKLAELCRRAFPDSYIIFMLAIGNADKPTATTDELHTRSVMMDILARSSFPNDTKVGIALTTEVRFIDKAIAVHQDFPTFKSVFAMGYDTLIRLADQKYYEEPVAALLERFFSNVEVVVLTRNADAVSKTPISTGKAHQQFQNFFTMNPLFENYKPKVHVFLATPETDQVSSSRARESEKELCRCVPPAVVEYVREKHLYKF